MGHIELAAPVAHIWFLKSLPSRIGLLLDMQLKQLERVLYFEAYIVIEPGLTPLEKYQLLTEDELVEAQDEYGEDAFSAGIGAEAVKQMLIDLDLEGEREILLKDLARSEEHTSELQSLMRISSAVFCLKKKKNISTDKKTIKKKNTHKQKSKLK